MLEDNAALQDDIVDTSDEDMEKLEKNLRMLGILGFVTALLSFVCVIGPGALLAIGIGVWAMRQARWSRAVHDGPGFPSSAASLATAGGIASIVSGIVQALIVVAVYALDIL